MAKESDGARRRALRAARVVTLGFVLATPGCYLSYENPADAAAAAHDGGPAVPVDAGTDAGLADAGRTCELDEEWAECCEEIGWDWNRGCAAWGPFVPPGEVA